MKTGEPLYEQANAVLANSLRSQEQWVQLLHQAGHYYKYSPYARLLIVAQVPDADFVAKADIWVGIMRRSIKPTAKPILAAEFPGDTPYRLFDVKDTFVRPDSRSPNPWKLQDPDALVRQMDDSASNFPLYIQSLAQQRSGKILGMTETISCIVLDRADQSLPLSWIRTSYTGAKSWGVNSMQYWMDASRAATDILTKIEKSIHIISKGGNTYGQFDIRESGADLRNQRNPGLGRTDLGGATGNRSGDPRTAGELRPSGMGTGKSLRGLPEVPDLRPDLDGSDVEGRAAGAGQDGNPSAGGGNRSQGAVESGAEVHRAVRAAATLGSENNRGAEHTGSNAVGQPGERVSNESQTDGNGRAGQFVTAEFSEAEAKTAPASIFSDVILAQILLHSSAFQDSKYGVYAHFTSGSSQSDTFLREEYGTGGTDAALTLDDTHFYSEFHTDAGIRVTYSDGTQEYSQLYSWQQAAACVGSLVAEGTYLTPDELGKYPEYLRGKEVLQCRMDVGAEFQKLIQDFNAWIVKTSPQTAQPNLYVMADCVRAFCSGEKTTDLPENNLVLPLMRMQLYSMAECRNEALVSRADAMLERLQALEFAELEPTPDQIQPVSPTRSEQSEPEIAATSVQIEQKSDASPASLDLQIGDTIVLDHKSYTVESVGLFDVVLHDPEAYPVSRAESRENLARLLQRPENRLIHSNAEPEPLASAEVPAVDFRIPDIQSRPGSQEEKYLANIAAIRTLNQLEAENRNATPEEQTTLSKYLGWGGLADCFDSKSKHYQELQDLLSPAEYASARASTLDAHYTDASLIREIYRIVERTGFTSGSILEPSAGIGNFLGAMPEAMAANSQVTAVELDNLSGRILKKLYPSAAVTIAGFETTKEKNHYDLAVGNVPFGQIKVNDPSLNRHNFSVHNYFFAKALEEVRPGGLIAFITSRYTMDSQSSAARRYIAQRADLLGAVRLPNTAFRNAGTEAVADILFLQKRPQAVKVEPDWVYVSKDSEYSINSYFVQHPEMVLGKLAWTSSQHGPVVTVTPTGYLPLQLQEAGSHITGQYLAASVEPAQPLQELQEVLPGDPTLRPWSFALRDNAIYYQENSNLERTPMNQANAARIRDMIPLRDCLRELIALQADAAVQDTELAGYRVRLNDLYDSFVKKHGYIRLRKNTVLSKDSSYPLLSSLEKYDSDRNYIGKADIFTKRTVRPYVKVTHVETAVDALALSLGERGRVDMDYMAEISGKDPKVLESELSGVVFRDISTSAPSAKYVPFEDTYLEKYPLVTADEYLSGNVRQKLRMAKIILDAVPQDIRSTVQTCVDALSAVQPKDLQPTEIAVRLGSTWIPTDDVKQFIIENLKPPLWSQRQLRVEYSDITAEWSVSGVDAYCKGQVASTSTYGTSRMNAYELIERTLNMRDIRINDTIHTPDGDRQRPNPRETVLVQQKQQILQDRFAEWIWEDPERRERLCTLYNEKFNSCRTREYDGSHLKFYGANPEIQLRSHQLGAIAHILYGGNTLLAHAVGAGKTFEMVASIMESKRLGLCQKAIIAVPNHLTEQWGAEFMTLYPSANILVTTENDFSKKNRQRLLSRIATGDYDAVILGHTQLERVPVSIERQKQWIQDELNTIIEGLQELKYKSNERFSVKQLERTRKNLEARLEKLNASDKKDDFLTFEQLGIDRLYIDEAHAYKNCFIATKMSRIAGLSTSESERSVDMLCKCRYIDELTNGRGIVFATGTPVSNSMVELYTMQRYLQINRLKELGFGHFDSWGSTFGKIETVMELAPEGTGYRSRTRFARFNNVPELMSIFKEVADIKTADELNLAVPTAEYINCVAKPTEIQKELVKQLSKRAADVHSGNVDSTVDNMLRITSDGRKLGLDQRLINPNYPDEPGTKLNLCAQNILKEYNDGAQDKLTQLVFCDLSTPKAEGFSVYTALRDKLIASGIPSQEIAFIHDADTFAKKETMFEKVRAGQIRVLLGSTQKMGAGTNVQDRMIAIHDLDAPWRPGDLEQRQGRLIRQGNQNEHVRVYRYVTEGTFDAYLWQTLETKQRYISQIMTSKSPVRSVADVDDAALDYAEIKALCAGDPRVKEKMELDVEVAKLRTLKSEFQSHKYALESTLTKHIPEDIRQNTDILNALRSDAETLNRNPHPTGGFAGMELGGVQYQEKKDAAAALMDFINTGNPMENLGNYRGFRLEFHPGFGDAQLYLHGKVRYSVLLGNDGRGNIQRIENVLATIPAKIEVTQHTLDSLQQQILDIREELKKPFAQEAVLAEKTQRLVALNAALDMEQSTIQPEQSIQEEKTKTVYSANDRLQELLEQANRNCPAEKFTQNPHHSMEKTRGR